MSESYQQPNQESQIITEIQDCVPACPLSKQFDKPRNFENLPSCAINSISQTYRQAFALPPYSENITQEDVINNINHMFENTNPKIVTILNEENETVGVAGGFEHICNEKEFWLEELAVNPNSQGKGLGKKTLNSIIELVKLENKYEIMTLKTTASNTKARGLYEKMGFKLDIKTILVPTKRENGEINMDTRVFYILDLQNKDNQSKNPNTDPNKESQLNRIDSLAICRPNGNDTAIVFDQDLLDSDRQILQQQICEKYPNVEQCGFVTCSQYPNCICKLEMFGGEFCGNATRSAVWLATKGQASTGSIEVSGVEKSLAFEVFENGDVKIEMPIDVNQGVEKVEDGYIVNLDGISHIVVPSLPDTDCDFEQLCKSIISKYSLDKLPACGVSFYDFDKNQSRFGVYVKSIDSFFDETACGSGTTAIGIVNNQLNKQTNSNIIQPTGQNIEFSIEDNVAYIRGTVTNLEKTSLKLNPLNNKHHQPLDTK